MIDTIIVELDDEQTRAAVDDYRNEHPDTEWFIIKPKESAEARMMTMLTGVAGYLIHVTSADDFDACNLPNFDDETIAAAQKFLLDETVGYGESRSASEYIEA